MRHAVIYTRISDEESAKTGYGLENQRHQCEEWCRKHAIPIRAVCTDEGISGSVPPPNGLPIQMKKSGKFRDGLGEALGKLEPGDILLVWRRDRIGRGDIILPMISWALQSLKVDLVSVVEQSDPANQWLSEVQSQTADFIASLERINCRHRTKAALDAKIRKGERVGTVRYGYRVGEDGKTLVPDQREQLAVEFMRRLRRKGIGYRTIAKQLTANGYLPRKPRMKGHPETSKWDFGTVRAILLRIEREEQQRQAEMADAG